MATEACSPQRTINCKLLMQLSVLFALLSTLFACLNVTAAAAQEPMTFVDTQPPPAFEGEYYEWQIKVQGGTPPYRFGVSGEMPLGLRLENRGAICGTPVRGTSTSAYCLSIRVDDSSSRRIRIEKPFPIILMYKSTLAIAESLFEGETNIYIDGNPMGKLKGGQKISQSFLAGTSPTVRVDSVVSPPTKDDIQFKPVKDYITVDGSSADATFDYICEYYIQLMIEPQDALYRLPDSYEWRGPTGWYREGSMLEHTTQNKIEGGPGVEYRFCEWMLPSGEQSKDANLNWKITASGNVTAYYDTYYYLTIIDSQYVTVDGEDWYKAGTTAEWRIMDSPRKPAGGLLGSLLSLKPAAEKGYVEMNKPQTISIDWELDWSPLLITVIGTIIVIAIIAACKWLIHLF